MSYRFDTPLITGAYHFGNRGLGVLGSEIASTGTNGPGYIYGDLSLPADANKEYSGYVETPPGVGTFFAFEDSSYIYEGPSTSFTYRLREDGVDKGTGTITIEMTDSPIASVNWTEVSDTFAMTGSVARAATISWTEDADTISGTAALTATATVSWTDANDVWSVTASAVEVGTTTASVAWGEVDDTFSLSGTLTQNIVSDVAWTESNDTFSVNGVVQQPASGSISWAEGSDSFHIIANIPSALPPLPSHIQVKFRNPKYKITFRRI